MKLLQIIKAVLWGFLGVRKRAGLEADASTIHPAQVIGIAIAMVAAFIVILLVIIRWALSELT